MLQVYARKAERFCLRPVSNAAIEQAISPALWYDLLDPSPQEVAEVEAALHIAIPTREEMEDIELSALKFSRNEPFRRLTPASEDSAFRSPDRG